MLVKRGKFWNREGARADRATSNGVLLGIQRRSVNAGFAIMLSCVLLFSVGCGLLVTRSTLEAECKEDDGRSCYDLASMWKNGQGGKKDLARARMYYEIACEKGEFMACILAGRMWRKGEGGSADESKAKYYFDEEKKLTAPKKPD